RPHRPEQRKRPANHVSPWSGANAISPLTPTDQQAAGMTGLSGDGLSGLRWTRWRISGLAEQPAVWQPGREVLDGGLFSQREQSREGHAEVPERIDAQMLTRGHDR